MKIPQIALAVVFGAAALYVVVRALMYIWQLIRGLF